MNTFFFVFVLAHMNGSGSTATPLFNGSDKFSENNKKYEAPSVTSENALLQQQKQQYQLQPIQQQPQSQYLQQGFVEGTGFSNGGTTQLRRTQSIISQNLRDQQYQLYCSGSSPPLQQQQQHQHQQQQHQQQQQLPQQQQYGETVVSQLQQHTVNNAYGLAEDAAMYGSGGVGVGLTSIARQTQQQQAMAVTQQRQQQYSVTNSLQSETNFTSSSGTGNTTTALQQLYNKRDGSGYDDNTSGSARFDSQQQTYQHQQEVLYQPYQPEYATYQQQQQPYNQQHQQQQQQQQQPQPQQQYQQQQFQQGQLPQYQRFPNQEQQQQPILATMGDNSQQYAIGQQQREDNNYTQNTTVLTHNGGLVTSGGTKYNTNDAMVVEYNSTAFRPFQQQLGQVSMKHKVCCVMRLDAFLFMYTGLTKINIMQ